MEFLDILALNAAMGDQNPDDELQRKIDALRQAFSQSLAERLAALDSVLAELRADAPLAGQAGAVRMMLEQAHKIAGSAGTFGYAEVSAVASEIEVLCDRILKGEHGADTAAHGELTAKMAALHAGAAL